MEAIQEQYIATSYFHHRVFSILNLPSWFSSMRPPDYEMQEHLHHISLDGTKHRDELENKTTKTVLPQKSKSKLISSTIGTCSPKTTQKKPIKMKTRKRIGLNSAILYHLHIAFHRFAHQFSLTEGDADTILDTLRYHLSNLIQTSRIFRLTEYV
jgi:hypothetical protein